MTNLPGAAWRKSSRSNASGSCVEVADNLVGVVGGIRSADTVTFLTRTLEAQVLGPGYCRSDSRMWGHGYGISLQRSAELAEAACGLDTPARMEAGSRVGPAAIRLAVVDYGRTRCRARSAAAIGDSGRAGGTTALASAPSASTHG